MGNQLSEIFSLYRKKIKLFYTAKQQQQQHNFNIQFFFPLLRLKLDGNFRD